MLFFISASHILRPIQFVTPTMIATAAAIVVVVVGLMCTMQCTLVASERKIVGGLIQRWAHRNSSGHRGYANSMAN